jgi:acetyl esterase
LKNANRIFSDDHRIMNPNPTNSAELRTQLREALRSQGAVIDPQGTKALYAPLLDASPRVGVNCDRDLTYGSHVRHRLDWYRPEKPVSESTPILIFVHGGGFIRGDKSERAHVGYAWARLGWETLIPNYRLAPEHGWPAGAHDVAAVCQWVRCTWPAWTQRPLFLVGESAGAAHVATALLCRRFNATQGWTRYGAALISGTYNPSLEAAAATQLGVSQPDQRNQAYFGADPNTWSEKGLIEQVDAPPFALWLSYAELDSLQFQVGTCELFSRLVLRHNFQPELNVIRGHSHLSQIYGLGTSDDPLTEPLSAWMKVSGLLE